MATDRSTLLGRRREVASITLVALCMTTALGLGLGSYLALCSRSAQFSTRNANLEKVRQLADTGIEEALWALNENNWTSSGPNSNATWTTSGSDRTISLNYTLPGSALVGTVAVRIANYASTGPTWPTITANATLSGEGNPAYAKSLRATTGPLPLFGNAIASSESYVSFVAGGTVDSWNSDPDNNPATAAVPYSFTAGNPNNYAAVVAGRGNGAYGVMLTQATVRGYVTSFGLPISYSTSGSPSASVVGPATAPGATVDTTRLGKSAFVPTTTSFTVTLPTRTTGGNHYGVVHNVIALVNAIFGAPGGVDVFTYNGSLTITGVPLVAPSLTISRPMKIIVQGDLAISGLGQITITSGGSLELFVAGDVTLGGLGIRNETNEPKKFALYCTDTSTTDSLQYNTSSDFCGVIYCENKPIEIQQNATFYGALLSRQHVRFMNSATSPVFHYDLALRQTRFVGAAAPYRITGLNEL